MSPELLRQVIDHCEACYPREGCGVVAEGPLGPEVRPVSNRATGPHFVFDPAEYLALLMDLDRRGQRVVEVFHSHIDQPAYLSEADRRLDVDLQLVISIRHGRACSARSFRRTGADWGAVELALPKAVTA